MECRTLRFNQQAYTESTLKMVGQEDAKQCLASLKARAHMAKADQLQRVDDRVEIGSKAILFARGGTHGPSMRYATQNLNCCCSIKPLPRKSGTASLGC